MPTDQTMSDWKALRKRQRADVSQTVINQFGKQLRIAGTHGYSVEDCLTACVTNGWRGFEYEWLKNRNAPRSAPPTQPQATQMPANWRPSAESVSLLEGQDEINLQFIEDAVPEFELYWRERGTACDNWDKKFREHVRARWAHHRASLEHDSTPRRIAADWSPSPETIAALRDAGVDSAFAAALVPEFRLYWRETNQINTAWNSKFLLHVKQKWAQRLVPGSQSTRDIPLADQLTDRSWADPLISVSPVAEAIHG